MQPQLSGYLVMQFAPVTNWRSVFGIGTDHSPGSPEFSYVTPRPYLTWPKWINRSGYKTPEKPGGYFARLTPET